MNTGNDVLLIIAAFFGPFVVIPPLILAVRGCKKLKEYFERNAFTGQTDPNLNRVETFSKHNASLYYWPKMSLKRPFTGSGSFFLSPQYIKDNIINSMFGRRWLIFQLVLTSLSICNYVFITYDNAKSVVALSLDYVFVFFFVLDYILYFYASEDRLRFFFTVYSVMDILAVVPSLTLLLTEDLSDTNLGFLRLSRALRVFRLYRLLSFAHSEVKRLILSAIVTVGIILFMSASIINILETIPNIEPIKPAFSNWHDTLYFITVSFTALGYGDLVPTNVYSRMFMMIMLMLLIFLIPYNATKISQAFNGRSPFHTDRYSINKEHVILAGDATYYVIVDFCREYFAVRPNSHIVILNPLIPSPALQRLLRSPFYQDKLTYLAGSPLNLNDLERSKAGNANAIFLMCSTNLTSGEHSHPIEKLTAEHCHSASENELKDAKIADAETITMILSVKNSFPSLPLFAQVHDIRSKKLASSCGADRVICIQESKMSILARASLTKSSSILIFLNNLFHTYPAPNNGVEKIQRSSDWLTEYLWGSSQQIYSLPIPKAFVGKRQHSESGWSKSSDHLETSDGDAHYDSYIQDDTSMKVPDAGYILKESDIAFCIALDGGLVDLVKQFKQSPLLYEEMELESIHTSGSKIKIEVGDHPALCVRKGLQDLNYFKAPDTENMSVIPEEDGSSSTDSKHTAIVASVPLMNRATNDSKMAHPTNAVSPIIPHSRSAGEILSQVTGRPPEVRSNEETLPQKKLKEQTVAPITERAQPGEITVQSSELSSPTSLQKELTRVLQEERQNCDSTRHPNIPILSSSYTPCNVIFDPTARPVLTQLNTPVLSFRREVIEVTDDDLLKDHIILAGTSNALAINIFLASVKLMFESSKDCRTSFYDGVDQSGNDQPTLVVLLLENEPNLSDVVWNEIFSNSNVKYVKGLPLRKMSLQRCGIDTCRCIILFCNGLDSPKCQAHNGNDKSENDLALLDSNVLFVTKLIQSFFPHVMCILELVNGKNVKLISPKSLSFSSKLRYTQSLLNNYALSTNDRLNVYRMHAGRGRRGEQAELQNSNRKTNPETNFTSFLSKSEEKGSNIYPAYHFDPIFAAGCVYSASLMTCLMCQTYFNPYMLEALTLVLRQAVQVELPSHLIGQSFGEVLVWFLKKRKGVVLGLLRRKPNWEDQDTQYLTLRKVPTFDQTKNTGSIEPVWLQSHKAYIPRNKKPTFDHVKENQNCNAIGSATHELPYLYTNPRSVDIVLPSDQVLLLYTSV